MLMDAGKYTCVKMQKGSPDTDYKSSFPTKVTVNPNPMKLLATFNFWIHMALNNLNFVLLAVTPHKACFSIAWYVWGPSWPKFCNSTRALLLSFRILPCCTGPQYV